MNKSNHFVYWYHLPTHTNYATQGYIGVTNNLTRRDYEHRAGYTNEHMKNVFAKYPKVEKTVLSAGTLEDCLHHETLLRPTPNIGWNIVSGGGKPPTTIKHSEATKAKISASNKGKNLGRKSPLKGVTGRWTKYQLDSIAKAHKGKVITQEHINSMRIKLSGGNSTHAKHIALEDLHNNVTTYTSIKEASDATGVGYSALRNSIQRKYIKYNKLGYKIRFDLSHPDLGTR